MHKRNTVAEAISNQRPVLKRPVRPLVFLDPIPNESKVQTTKGDSSKIVIKDEVDKYPLPKNLSFAYEMNQRPNTQSNTVKPGQRKLVSRGASVKDALLNQQYLVSDAVMRQRMVQTFIPKEDEVCQIENKVRWSEQIN